MAKEIFVTAINCMDGRVQLPIIEWMKKQYNAQYVDLITEPGPLKHMAEKNNLIVDSIKQRVEVSVRKHGSRVVAIVGHYDCTGNPVDKTIQLQQLDSALQLLSSWDLNISLLPLWVDEQWTVHDIEKEKREEVVV
jgi:carbonic anhydrase